MNNKLTNKQESFCLEYVIDKNATQAAIRAGYSKKTAAQIGEQNLRKLEISKRIDSLLSEQAKRCEIDADYVLNGLKDLHQMCIGEKEISVHDSEGALVNRKIFEHAGAKGSLELLGKHLKLFDQKEEKGTGEIHIHINGKAALL